MKKAIAVSVCACICVMVSGCARIDTRFTERDWYDDSAAFDTVVQVIQALNVYHGGDSPFYGVAFPDPEFLKTLAINGTGGGKQSEEVLKHTVWAFGAKATQRDYRAFITVPPAGGYNVSIGGTGQNVDSTAVPMAGIAALAEFGGAALTTLGPGFMDYLQAMAARPPKPASPPIVISPMR